MVSVLLKKLNSFIGCENLSGESKANLIMDTLTKSELNIEHLRGVMITMEQEICLEK